MGVCLPMALKYLLYFRRICHQVAAIIPRHGRIRNEVVGNQIPVKVREREHRSSEGGTVAIAQFQGVIEPSE